MRPVPMSAGSDSSKRRPPGWLLVGALVLCAVVAVGVVLRARGRKPPVASSTTPSSNVAQVAQEIRPAPDYVGRQVCASCHKREDDLWRGSHHDLAMQKADATTVLGDFNDVEFTYFGVTSRFFKKDDKPYVRTDGPDGQLHDYEIAYTFGVYPLQQYLIPFPGGRYQALNVCWDARPKEQGGQRWFHLYPDDKVAFDDILHWTGPYQNWNHMCAECHSTNVRKGYDATSDTFKTTFSEINVSCEACHGPGSAHVAWADEAKRGSRDDRDTSKGLVIDLSEPKNVVWTMDPGKGISRRDPPRESNIRLEVCARCHSRRGEFSEDYIYGKPMMDTHRPALLEASLYEPDGQVLDEVFEYQSFLQSKMHAAGVTCTDCHNAHSLTPPAGNGLCLMCHLPEKYDTPSHHFHKAESTGAACTACHLATKNYMVVHARHDHSFRVPRPDLTVKIGTRNACNQCHSDQSPQWAAEAAAKWWGTARTSEPHYGEALHAGNENLASATVSLVALANDATGPMIVRASAVALLGDRLGPTTGQAVQRALGDNDPMMRSAAVDALRDAPPELRAKLLAPLLSDAIRMVRIDAARALASVPGILLTAEQQKARARGLDEYRAAQRVDADRAEGHLNLGALHAELGEFDEAEREYQTARMLSSRFPPTYVNLGDLYRQLGRDDEATRILDEGVRLAPMSADLHHALGLALVRQKQTADAIKHLARAAELSPGRERYAYVYGVALNSVSQAETALRVLKSAHERHRGSREILIAVITISRDTGDRSAAIEYAKKLVELDPTDPSFQGLLTEMQGNGR